jgi:dolichyl-phosphate-mannose-protein mannosyltransferase
MSAARIPRLWAPWWLGWVVAAVAFVVRVIRLDRPPVFVFDEIYYVGDAASLYRSGVERGVPVHPPLGKWLIGLGMQLFGINPTGWRIASVVAGAIISAIVAMIAWHWTQRIELALLAGLLVTVDGIMFTASRVAMLDIFEALFVVLAAHACTVALGHSDPRRQWRWQMGAAVWLGLGAATTWSALYTLPVLVAVIAGQAWQREGSPARRLSRMLGHLGAAGAVTVVTYLLAFAPTFVTNPSMANPVTFLRRQRMLVQYHLSLDPTSTYAHPAIDWLAQLYPTGLLIEHCTAAMSGSGTVCPTDSHHATVVAVVSLANPVVWVLGIAALPVLVASLVYLRRGGGLRQAVPVLALGLVAVRWLPWMFTRAGYSFYSAALVPFLVLAAVAAMSLLPRRAGRYAAVGVGALAICAFAFFYPYLAGVPMSASQLRLREWLSTWP